MEPGQAQAAPGRPAAPLPGRTAYCDDVAARIVTATGNRLVSFSVNGDGGATFTPGQVRSTVTAAPGGSVVICHMNHPGSGTAQELPPLSPPCWPAGTASSASPNSADCLPAQGHGKS